MSKRKIDQQLNRLDQSLEQLIALLSTYSSEQLNRKPAPEAWSAMQVVNHLLMAETGSAYYLRKKLSDPDNLSNLSKAGLGTAFRNNLLKLSLWVPYVKFKAPPMVSTDKLPLVSERDVVFEQWKTARKDLRAYLATLPEAIFAQEAYRHPRAGRITIGHMLEFFEAHFNRHLKQIKRTLAR